MQQQTLIQKRLFSISLARLSLSLKSYQTVRSPRNVSTESVTGICGERNQFSFQDPNQIFCTKPTKELARSALILKLCSFDWLVGKSDKILGMGKKVLGNQLYSALLKRTLYGQFVAGENRLTIEKTIHALQKAGIRPLLAIPMEEDISEFSNHLDERYEKNLTAILDCIELSAYLDDRFPMMQLKMTALLPADICAALSKLHPLPSQDKGAVLKIASSIRTGRDVLINGLSTEQLIQLQKGIRRLQLVGQVAMEKNVIVMMDAEYTYLNPAINMLSLAMMLNFNINRPLIFYTYQNYLKSALASVISDTDFINAFGIKFGAKLVRGAYMNKERMLAQKYGYPDPINISYDATSIMYKNVVDNLLDKIARDPQKCSMIIATHNEKEVLRCLERINQLCIDRQSGAVFFGQLLGMCDHVSYALGFSGYLVCKSLPYGPVDETIPYLVRRVMENRSVLNGVRRERVLIQKALWQRLSPFTFS